MGQPHCRLCREVCLGELGQRGHLSLGQGCDQEPGGKQVGGVAWEGLWFAYLPWQVWGVGGT